MSLKHLIYIFKPYVICLQETCLLDNTDITDLKARFDKYHFYFKNRNGPHGGVGMLIHESLPHTRIFLNSIHEAIAFNIRINSKLLSICSIYLPGKSKFTVNSLKVRNSNRWELKQLKLEQLGF